MPRGNIIDPALTAELKHKYNTADSAAERRSVVLWGSELTGLSDSSIYRLIGSVKKERKPVKNDLQIQQELKDAKIIAAIKSQAGDDKKWIPTDAALDIAVRTGLISAGRYTRSTMDRILTRLGLNKKMAGKRPAAMKLTAKYPGHVFVVDATTMDQYYMRLDGVTERHDLAWRDQHLDDYLVKHSLVKIWVYYVVDLYSKVFLAIPTVPTRKVASKNGGENATDWLNNLIFAMKPKKGLPSPLEGRDNPLENFPLEGVPEILFCDRGSGIGQSSLIARFCAGIGTKIVTHLPGNPSAKGAVESRIGAFKRTYESRITNSRITSFEELQYYYYAWSHAHSEAKGYSEKWRKGVIGSPVPVLQAKNVHDATVSHFTRTIDGWGCVSIDKAQLFVHHDAKYQGAKIDIYRSVTRGQEFRYLAVMKDNKIIELKPFAGSHDIETPKSYPKTEGDRNRDEVRELRSGVRNAIGFDDILPPAAGPSNLVRLPQKTRQLATHSPMPPETFTTAEEAWRYILNQTKMSMDQVPEIDRQSIDRLFRIAAEDGGVSAEFAITCANIINKHKEQGEQAL